MKEAKEKAKELVDKFWFAIPESGHNIVKPSTGNTEWIFDSKSHKNNCKACATICVDEILNEPLVVPMSEEMWYQDRREFWQDVKNEIKGYETNR